MRSQAVAATRQLAKRQLTWLRSFRELEPAENLVHSFL
jgi:tRNA A37 N6-isopentenylltransferase MiaA